MYILENKDGFVMKTDSAEKRDKLIKLGYKEKVVRKPRTTKKK